MMKLKFIFKLMELNLKNLYDDSFYVEQSNWKTWKSYDKDRNALVTSLTQETCIAATRFYCKGLQEGFGEGATSYEGSVGGKL
jgi:hypothetical protein